MQRLSRWPVLARLVLVLAALTAIWAGLMRATGGPGWIVTALPAGEEVGTPLFTSHDLAPSTLSVERLERAAGVPVALRWTGVLYVAEAREYRIGAATAGRLRLRIDNLLLLEHAARDGVDDISESMALAAGPHAIILEYERRQGPANLELRWDVGNPYRMSRIPATVMARRFLAPWQQAIVGWSQVVGIALGVAWSVVLAWGAWRVVYRALPRRPDADARPLGAVLAAVTTLFVIGIWWGWPDGFWAPDELDPGAIQYAISQRFANGWHDRYPPMHYYVLSAIFAPTLLFAHLGWLDATGQPALASLMMLGRATSVAMTLGTIYCVGLVAARLVGKGQARAATILAALLLPLGFYAKLANLDAPYLFWFALSLVFLVDAHRTRRTRDVVGFAVTGALAIATKDQAYALYVLPALHLGWRLARGGDLRALAVGALAGVMTLVVTFNVAWNWEGFKSHVALITGPASEGYRMFAPDALGQWQLAKATVWELMSTLGIAGMLLVAMGFIALRRLGTLAADRPVWTGVALIPLSYYLTFVAPIGYMYDRFLMPLLLLLAVVGALGFHALRHRPGDAGRFTKPAAWLAMSWLLWRAVSVDALMVRDARYEAERWLEQQLTRDHLTASVNQFGYLPRLERYRHRFIQPTRDDTLDARPDFIVVNTEFAKRDGAETPVQRWLTWLGSEESPYREVFRHKQVPAWSALSWERRFTDRVEDPFSNLDKINPEIVIYRRHDSPVR